MRFRLRTLLIVLAVGPVLLWLIVPPAINQWQRWQRERECQRAIQAAMHHKLLEEYYGQTVSPLP